MSISRKKNKRIHKRSRRARKIKKVNSQINKLQKGGFGNDKKSAIVVVLQQSPGFFSQFLYLCNVYIYAKEQGVNFYIENNNWQYTYKDGWHDYFKTLNVFKDEGQYTNVKRYIIPNNEGIPIYKTSQYIECIKEIFILKDELQKKIDDYIKEIGSEYNSLYIRRGDKVMEVELMSIDDILSQTNIKNEAQSLFIQTDDYTSVEYLKTKIPLVKLVTLTPKTMRGSNNQEMTSVLTREEIKADTENLLMSCVVFGRAKMGWSYYHSNVGIFHKLYNYSGVSLYNDKLYSKEEVDSKFNLNSGMIPYLLFPIFK